MLSVITLTRPGQDGEEEQNAWRPRARVRRRTQACLLPSMDRMQPGSPETRAPVPRKRFVRQFGSACIRVASVSLLPPCDGSAVSLPPFLVMQALQLVVRGSKLAAFEVMSVRLQLDPHTCSVPAHAQGIVYIHAGLMPRLYSVTSNSSNRSHSSSEVPRNTAFFHSHMFQKLTGPRQVIHSGSLFRTLKLYRAGNFQAYSDQVDITDADQWFLMQALILLRTLRLRQSFLIREVLCMTSSQRGPAHHVSSNFTSALIGKRDLGMQFQISRCLHRGIRQCCPVQAADHMSNRAVKGNHAHVQHCQVATKEIVHRSGKRAISMAEVVLILVA